MNKARSVKHEVQEPATPAGREAVKEKMKSMKEKADKVVEKTGSGGQASQAFQQGALEITCAMRPHFGPANAWLFNERDKKIEALAKKLGISMERAEELFDPHQYDALCRDMNAIIETAVSRGYEVETAPVNRRDLLWSPAPGFALGIEDPLKTIEWRHPYSKGPKQKKHPRLTVFVFPPREGNALRHFFTRHQPGEPFFYTGNLMAYTLQTPQSHDVAPDKVRAPLLEAVKKQNLFFVPPDKALSVLQSSEKMPIDSANVRNGIITVKGCGPPPLHVSEELKGCAVLWIRIKGSAEELSLMFVR